MAKVEPTPNTTVYTYPHISTYEKGDNGEDVSVVDARSYNDTATKAQSEVKHHHEGDAEYSMMESIADFFGFGGK